MIQRPRAAITICVDRRLAQEYGFGPDAPGPLIDVGTAAATMLLAAHALGIGAGPVTSFSRAAAAVVLDLPDGWSAEMIVCLGHPAAVQPVPIGARRKLSWRDLTRWAPDAARSLWHTAARRPR
jgi:nitroreductase